MLYISYTDIKQDSWQYVDYKDYYELRNFHIIYTFS